MCNIESQRKLMSELLFECYGVPSVAYGVDSLFGHADSICSTGGNIASTSLPDGLIISSGYQASYVVAFHNQMADWKHAKRLDLGGFHCVRLWLGLRLVLFTLEK